MRTAFIVRLSELARDNDRIMLVTGDLGFGVLTDFARVYPNQFLNVGVAEQNMTGVATGLALGGRTVFTYSIANFPTLRCLEQIRNDAAYHDANVKIVAIGGGYSYGPLGMSHHATEDLSIMRAIPNITVVSPGCLWETEEVTTAIAGTPGTAYLRLDKSHAGRTNVASELFELGRVRRIREGSDLTLIATGGILGAVLQAADRLASDGMACRVLSAHTLRPFDTDAIFRAARDTGGILTIEENVVDGGLGGLVAETCLEGGVVPSTFHRIGVRGGFSSVVGSQEYLRQQGGMDAETIAAKARELVRSGGKRASRAGGRLAIS